MSIIIGELLWVIIGIVYIGGKIIKEQVDIARSKRDPFWWSSKNYNLERQNHYKMMTHFEKDEVEKILGRPVVIRSPKTRRDIVTELLAREGIDYFDLNEASEEEAKAKGWKRRW